MWILAPPFLLWILKEHSSLHYPPCISSTQITIHLWLRVGEGAPLKESSGGKAGSICGDTYGFLAWLNMPDKSLPPKRSPTASTFLPLFFFSPATSLNLRLTEPLSAPHLLSDAARQPRFPFVSEQNVHQRDSHTVPSITHKVRNIMTYPIEYNYISSLPW